MKIKGLTMTIVFEAESANYGEGIGNVSTLKKLTRGNGDQYTYISRQAIRYNIVEQLGEPLAQVESSGSGDKTVVQFSADSTIKDYPEIDFFGYLKTEKGTGGKKRSAVVRLSNAVSTESFKGDLDFLTNKGLADRLERDMNIAQAEIHKSYYVYTIAIDLDQIGIDKNYDIEAFFQEKIHGKLIYMTDVNVIAEVNKEEVQVFAEAKRSFMKTNVKRTADIVNPEKKIRLLK